MPLLQQIIEPKKLLLVWQKIDRNEAGQLRSGHRHVVGELSRRTDGQVVLHYFSNDPDFQAAQQKGFEGYPAFGIEQETHETNVMDAFQRRLPPESRADFDDYLTYHGIDPAVRKRLSPFALLGYTGAKLPGDGFSLVHSFEGVEGPCELITELAGFRHNNGMQSFQTTGAQGFLGKHVTFAKEPENPVDNDAVKVTLSDTGALIGYVNRAQRHAFGHWLDQHRQVEGTIQRLNGKLDRPDLLLHVNVH
jgi:hypothetical protein